jgi:hypothetical protein
MQNKYFYWPYSNEIFYTKALAYKEYFSEIDLWGIPRSSRDIRDFLYEIQNVWPSGEYNT